MYEEAEAFATSFFFLLIRAREHVREHVMKHVIHSRSFTRMSFTRGRFDCVMLLTMSCAEVDRVRARGSILQRSLPTFIVRLQTSPSATCVSKKKPAPGVRRANSAAPATRPAQAPSLSSLPWTAPQPPLYYREK